MQEIRFKICSAFFSNCQLMIPICLSVVTATALQEFLEMSTDSITSMVD